MKKQLSKKGVFALVYTFIFISSMVHLSSCSNTDSSNLIEDWPDQMQLKGHDYNSFAI